MKRMKVLGLCLIAIFALSATMVATAQAGKYNEGPVKVLDAGEGEAELGNSVANIRCKSHEGTSEVVSGIEAKNIVATYHGCEAVGKGASCQNGLGGEIVTDKLRGVVNWISKSEKKVGQDFHPESGSELAKFECTGLFTVSVFGDIIGEITSALNTMTTTGHLSFKEFGFKNIPAEFEGGGNEHLEAEFSTTPGTKVESGQIQQDNTTNHMWKCKVKKGVESCKKQDEAELSTASGKPEYGRCEKNGAGTKYTDNQCQHLPEGKEKAKYGLVAP